MGQWESAHPERPYIITFSPQRPSLTPNSVFDLKMQLIAKLQTLELFASESHHRNKRDSLFHLAVL